MFKSSGSLGAFEVKADLGFLLRIYEQDVHADLVTMGKIRNAFVHWRKPIKFNSKDIKALCRQLKIVDKDEYPRVPGPGFRMICVHRNGWPPMLRRASASSRQSN